MSSESGTVIHNNALSGGASISISIHECMTVDREKKEGNLRAGFASSARFLVSFLMRNLVKKMIHVRSGVFLVGALSSLGLRFGVLNFHYAHITVHPLVITAVICNKEKELRCQ